MTESETTSVETKGEPDPILGTTVLGRYRVITQLAQGGMGIVYLARTEGAAGFAKPVVVKRVLPNVGAGGELARLFVREAKILSNLQHPNIVSVTDFGEEAGAYIMVLDYVRAYHLGRWYDFREKEKRPFPVDVALHVMTKVLDALEFAHTLTSHDGEPLHIVHADVSPSNILVDTDGQVKLLDFGIARMAGEVTKSSDRATIRGKFAYLPIEALDGSPPQVTTDLYAAAVVVYELLAGENPFQASDDTRTLAKVISHTPPLLSTLRADVPPELDAIVARGMSKDRSERYPSAKEFARELRRLQKRPEDEVVAELTAMVRADYAAMPSEEHLSLSELEKAWRNPPAPRPSEKTRASLLASGEVEPAATSATSQAGFARPAESAAAPRRGRATWAVGLVGLLALAGLGGALAIALRKKPPDEPQFVVIDRNPSTAPAIEKPDAPPPAVDAAAALPSADTSVARPAASLRLPKPGQDPLSAAFAKNQPAVEACFRDNASGVDGAPELSVRFTIDRSGAVQKAELIPPQVSGVPLGQCVLGVARRTPFPPQPEPATFRIPIRARKVN